MPDYQMRRQDIPAVCAKPSAPVQRDLILDIDHTIASDMKSEHRKSKLRGIEVRARSEGNHLARKCLPPFRIKFSRGLGFACSFVQRVSAQAIWE